MPKTRLVLTSLVVCLLSLSIVACGGGGSTIDFEDTLWYLESYGEQGNMKSVLEHTSISTTFVSKEGRIRGNGGCNGYSAGYELDDVLSVSPVARTEMYCSEPEGIMDQEDEYLRILESASTLTIEDGKLNLSGDEGVLIFIKSTGRRPER